MQNKKKLLTHFIIFAIVAIIVSIAFTMSSASGDWENVGKAGFSDGIIYEASIATHREICSYNSSQEPLFFKEASANQNNIYCDVVYVAFLDGYRNYKMTVMKYTGTKWENVGNPGFSLARGLHSDLAVNSKGVPYVVFSDYANGEKLTVMMYEAKSNQWKYVGGNTGITNHIAADTSLQFDSNDIPYLSFTTLLPPNGQEAVVMRYIDSKKSWENVGQATPSGVFAIETALSISPDNTPYIVFTGSHSGAPYLLIRKYNNSKKSWEDVGNTISSYPHWLSIKVNSKNVPYVSYFQGTNAVVSKYDSITNKWQSLGNAGVTSEPPSLIIGPDDAPYVVFADDQNKNKVTVKLYNAKSSKWENVGKPAFSQGMVQPYDNKAMAFGADGSLQVTFVDYYNSNKISVMKKLDVIPSPIISGSVTDKNGPRKDVIIYTDPDVGNTKTDVDGKYSLKVDYAWSGKVLPSQNQVEFTPEFIKHTNVIKDQTNKNYTVKGGVTISGTVTNSKGVLSGVSISDGTNTVQTDANGKYSLTVNSSTWSGTVTASKDGCDFAKPSKTYTSIKTDQVNQNYTCTIKTYIISGVISGMKGPLKGVRIAGAKNATTTDINGKYSLKVDYDWSGKITPLMPNVSFVPPNQTYSNVKSNQTQDYQAMVSISGRIMTKTWNVLRQTKIPGATVKVNSQTVDASSGTYTYSVVYGSAVTITPSAKGYTFTPANRFIKSVIINTTRLDFEAKK